MMRKIQPKKMGGEMGMSHEMPKEIFPSVYFDHDTLPEAKDWKVGKTYKVTLKIKQTGMSMRKGRDGKEHGNYDFDIVGIDPHGEVAKEVKRYKK